MKYSGQNSLKRYLLIISYLYFIITLLVFLKYDANASLYKFIHSTHFYSEQSEKLLRLQMPENMINDLGNYKIYLQKSSSIDTPLNKIIDGGELVFDHISISGHNLFPSFRTKHFCYNPEWWELYAYPDCLQITSLEERREEFIELYWCSYEEGGCVIDVSDLQHLYINKKTSLYWSHVDDRGYAYSEENNGIDIYDLSNPNELIKLGKINCNGILKIEGTTAYILDYDSNIHLVNITDPMNPIEVSTLSFNIDSLDLEDTQIFIEHDSIYVTSKPKWDKFLFYVINVKDLEKPAITKTYIQDGSEGFLKDLNVYIGACEKAYISNNYLCFIGTPPNLYERRNSRTQLIVIEISPNSLTRRAVCITGALCSSDDNMCCLSTFSKIYVKNDYAYLIRDHSPGTSILPGPSERDIYTSYQVEICIIDLKKVLKISTEENRISIYPKAIIPLNGSRINDFIIRDNFGYFCLEEGGIQISEIPVHCSNLQWADANTISAEISMPISEGLYNVVVEVEKEDVVVEVESEGEDEENDGPQADEDAETDRENFYYSKIENLFSWMNPLISSYLSDPGNFPYSTTFRDYLIRDYITICYYNPYLLPYDSSSGPLYPFYSSELWHLLGQVYPYPYYLYNQK